MSPRSALLSLFFPSFTLLVLLIGFKGYYYNKRCLSPQGCEMSWMSPSYVLQSDFNVSWTPLGKRYSLWLYREVGWETDAVLHGNPVLFIPGNAGSSRQARSIASSAIRQVYTSPYVASQDWTSGVVAPVDIFTAEFNEDLSAFHGPTLLSQKAYIDAAIDYILSRYPAGRQVLLLGHSMGGLVATAVLPSPRISAIITMSSPHSLPPMRFDRRIEDIYSSSIRALYPRNQTTEDSPVLAICGGATDELISGETCYLPTPPANHPAPPYRRTVFTAGLRGVWTGVGHNEMVWCHQVRWHVARAVIELAASKSFDGRVEILDRVFSMGISTQTHTPAAKPAVPTPITLASEWTFLKTPFLHVPSQNTGHTPSSNPHLYLIPISSGQPSRLVLQIQRGALLDSRTSTLLAGAATSSFQVSLFLCQSSAASSENVGCTPLDIVAPGFEATVYPLPVPSKAFPAKGEGWQPGDEGVVVITDPLVPIVGTFAWVGLQVSGAFHGHGVAAALDPVGPPSAAQVGLKELVLGTWALAPFLYSVPINLGSVEQPAALVTEVRLPRLATGALVSYKVTPSFAGQCLAGSDEPSVMLHRISSTSEHHFHALQHTPDASPVLLHDHTSGPFTPPVPSSEVGVRFRVYTPPDAACRVETLYLTVDYSSTFGRWALRYWKVFAVWGVAVSAGSTAAAWLVWETGDPFPTPSAALSAFITHILPRLSGAVLVPSLLSFLPKSALLGAPESFLQAPIAVIALWIGVGYVGLQIGILEVLQWGLRRVARRGRWRSGEASITARKRSITTFLGILVLVATFIPHQVAFVITWLIHLWTCAIPPNRVYAIPASLVSVPLTAIPPRSPSPSPSSDAPESTTKAPDADTQDHPPSPTPQELSTQLNTSNINHHILLLQTLLIPMQSLVFAVWIRTLATAGLTAPFDGDHNVLYAAFWVLLTEELFNGGEWKRSARKGVRLVAPILLAVLTTYSILFGVRYPFAVYEIVNVFVAWLVITRFVSIY